MKKTNSYKLNTNINHTVAFRIAVRISNVVKVSNGLSDSRARANVSWNI